MIHFPQKGFTNYLYLSICHCLFCPCITFCNILACDILSIPSLMYLCKMLLSLVVAGTVWHNHQAIFLWIRLNQYPSFWMFLFNAQMYIQCKPRGFNHWLQSIEWTHGTDPQARPGYEYIQEWRVWIVQALRVGDM